MALISMLDGLHVLFLMGKKRPQSCWKIELFRRFIDLHERSQRNIHRWLNIIYDVPNLLTNMAP